ncbi:hypothetical protein E5K00_19405 [Hymenobacter aquaticus]|uniref:HEAT repeat domain-containing protein n=1 Tax=Hymenobacter aquaticus TaxID=1867101 RepID=A0A4Z0PYM8_9BACT|nr:hypothetical protein [Hymenobacter aquaticus]TGE22409.1 hypothetical protein E5K00_19405 [Hymenobacter aquaticus]
MNLSKTAHLTHLRASIAQAASAGNTERQQILKALLSCWNKKGSFLSFAPFLEDDTDRVVQWFVADAFAYAKDEQVVELLMKAAVASINQNYRSTLIWPCIRYDCTKHLEFFTEFILRCSDPGEAMLAGVFVIEAMQGPFEPHTLKQTVHKLLTQDNPATDAAGKLQHEVFRVQAAHALLNKYFGQIDKDWNEDLANATPR